MKHKLLLPLSMLLVTGCEGPNNQEVDDSQQIVYELDYQITSDKQIGWNELFDINQPRYMVYFYSEYCGYCKLVKQEVLSYFMKDIDEMYFVNVTNEKAIYKSNDGLLIGTKSINDFYIFGTPFLVEITNRTVTNWYAGVESIRLYIDTRMGQ